MGAGSSKLLLTASATAALVLAYRLLFSGGRKKRPRLDAPNRPSADSMKPKTNTASPDAKDVLSFWLGPSFDRQGFQWRGGLWFRHIDGSLGKPADGRPMTPLLVQEATCKRVQALFAPLIDSVSSSPAPTCCPAGFDGPVGQAALVVAYTQLIRLARKGQGPAMFDGYEEGSRIARGLISSFLLLDPTADAPCSRVACPPPGLEWPHLFFACLALVQSESEPDVNYGAAALREVIAAFKKKTFEDKGPPKEDDGAVDEEQGRDVAASTQRRKAVSQEAKGAHRTLSGMRTAHKEATDRASILRQFGRYPQVRTISSSRLSLFALS